MSGPSSDPTSGGLDAARRAVLRVRTGRGGGSAVVWSSSPGVTRIVTNHHVLAPGGEVRLDDESGGTFEAAVRASSPALDLALLEVAGDLPSAHAVGAELASPRLGELVFALGHPLGRPWVWSRGVVSGLGAVELPGGRGDVSGGREWVRSDVRLAPGNSGGPLLNVRGELVGINSMVWGGRLGVAIPGVAVRTWLDELGAARDGHGTQLGVSVTSAVLAGRAVLMVASVEPDSAADEAGMRIGDVLIAVNGSAIREARDLRSALGTGAPLTLDLWRAGEGVRLDVTPRAVTRAA